jgi:hypothetical protein
LDLILEARQEEYIFARTPELYRVAIAAGLAIAVTLFAANQVSAFIYFQF